jgi:hypothetical protein
VKTSANVGRDAEVPNLEELLNADFDADVAPRWPSSSRLRAGVIVALLLTPYGLKLVS